jgi:hypothetical protein
MPRLLALVMVVLALSLPRMAQAHFKRVTFSFLVDASR